ncbi:MAG: DUF1361 domain-containing protein [Oscillatoriophycideae cyanobacterium NC_groundwater_1537_Pr4_S-0.65um_50_18]|nr:DUF1361 domain-containing protein [Oscillatoriophycideae cyanobacterium NC_groundwater_1537_Pr4_S-0.65um_50_18]
MQDRAFQALEAFSGIYSGWILWNLFLAFIPLVLSFWLFRRKTIQKRSLLWWLVFVVFVAFLPNAPYMLTDIIHLIRGTRAGYAMWLIILIFIPLHLMAILGGFEAYVVSLLNQGSYLKRQGAGQFVFWSEILAHALCAIGIFLGRFIRFNSWDLVTDPADVLTTTMNTLTSRQPLLIILLTFGGLTVLYWLMKQLTLGIYLRIHYARRGLDIPD